MNSLILILAAVVLFNTASAQTVLPLKQGTYVSEGTPCKDAPLAETQMVDRSGVQYPHLQGCKAHVTEHQGASYRLDQICNDGDHDKIVVKILAPNRYSVGEGRSAKEFRFCSDNSAKVDLFKSSLPATSDIAVSRDTVLERLRRRFEQSLSTDTSAFVPELTLPSSSSSALNSSSSW